MPAASHVLQSDRLSRREFGRSTLTAVMVSGGAVMPDVPAQEGSGPAVVEPKAGANENADQEPSAGRKLDFKIGQGFTGASARDIVAVLQSAGSEIWKHCPNTLWKVPGFFIFHSEDHPITRFDHTLDGRVAIGLTTLGTYWSQFAFQFSHEFCHALAGHSNDWNGTWIRGRKSNHWLEESICEVASLFAMRSMAKTWEIAPPYPNWKNYAPALSKYAGDRLQQVESNRGTGFSFPRWFAEHETKMRKQATQRDWNNIVAAELLPCFEAEPSGWESIAFFNRTDHRDPEKPLTAHFGDWSKSAPAAQRPFVARIAAKFGVRTES